MRSVGHYIPKRFPVVLEDRILYWMQNSHCSVFNLIAAFDGRLDEKRMKRAVRLVLDAEPVLGCRFVNKFGRQYWERLDDLDSLEHCTVVPESEHKGDPAAYLDSQPDLDVHKGPQIRAYILRGEGDALCLRLNHVAADGGGLKDLGYALARIYNQLEKDPDHRPEPNVKGSRSLNQVFRHFSPKDYAGMIRRGFLDMWGFASGRTRRKAPLVFRKPVGSTMFMREIGPRRFLAAKEYGKKRGATLNDVMVAAMLRSFYSVVNPDENAYLRAVTTADLRRYIPGEQSRGVCNLSGFSYINIGKGAPNSFDDLLKVVARQFSSLKKDYIGLGSIPLTALVFKTLPFSMGLWIHDRLGELQKKQTATTGDVALLFTNAGRIEPERFTFGNIKTVRAAVTTTRATPPVLAVCLGGFENTLAVTAGFCQNTISKRKVLLLLDRLEQELEAMARESE